MNQDLITRYQPGGDIYGDLASQYGIQAANLVASAAATADSTNVTEAIAQIRSGGVLNDSTWSIFGNQLVTDPLGAPLESANNVLSNSFVSLLKSPAVLVVVALALFVWLGGIVWLKQSITKK